MKAGPERTLLSTYLERAGPSGRPLGLTGFSIAEFTESRAASAAQRKADEARLLRGALAEKSILVCLDEHGRSLGSEPFASQLLRWRDDGKPAVSFIIGGADGLDPSLLAEATFTLSFSPMTWPHQLVRIMLAEQLYRATTILTGHPYHRA